MHDELQSISNRFWAKVDRRGPDECWPWKGAVIGRFGIMQVEPRPTRKRETAHRIAAKLSGLLKDDADLVKHTCRNDLCCNPAHLYVKVRPVDVMAGMAYNLRQRKESPLAFEETDLARRFLAPLRQGKSVVMVMDDPKMGQNPKYRGTKKQRLVVIAPGLMHGFSETCLLVSIVGGGACIVSLNSPHNVANLVLAGMPARLAHELMNQIHQVLKE